MNNKRTILTAALPYANGSLHIGHMVEYVLADCKARLLRSLGKDVIFVGGDDNHGTPVEIKAQELGLTQLELIDRIWEEHRTDFKQFGISFDNYHRTHSPENEIICQEVYQRLCEKGLIKRKMVRQYYDNITKRFLADRHLSGECPYCGAKDQYGDVCESCSRTYSAVQLKNPVSRFSGTVPVFKESEHLFFDLAQLEGVIRAWADSGTLQSQTLAKLQEWLNDGLRDWDISREAPYFGFPIPGETGKYFYVWVDAPLGYLAGLSNYCNERGLDWRDLWNDEEGTQREHIIGKDILNFHACFWPALLHGGDLALPDKVICHGFLTVNGRKMSKSRGTLVTASDLADRVAPEAFRYYILSQLNGGIDDIDLNVDVFVERINTDLVGKYANLATRALGLLAKHGRLELCQSLVEPRLHAQLLEECDLIVSDFACHNSASALRRIMAQVKVINQAFSEAAPWASNDTDYVQAWCSQALLHFRVFAIMMQPVCPQLAADSLAIFGIPKDKIIPWSAIEDAVPGGTIKPVSQLFERLKPEIVEDLFGGLD